MSKKITFILEPDSGKLTAEVSGISTEALMDLRADLGVSQNVNCGRPLESKISKSRNETASGSSDNQSIWLYRIYHNSVVDGPGRRSVIQVAGCSIRCAGCYVPETHERSNGKLVSIASVVQEIVANRPSHDGVTILGGEPFDQPGPVAELVSRLLSTGTHITVYSGHTVENLIHRGDSNTHYILTHIDLLIDGPFVTTFRAEAGDYRGSQNQRLIGTPSVMSPA